MTPVLTQIGNLRIVPVIALDSVDDASPLADALVAGGFFGKCSDASIKLSAATGAKNQTVQTLKIEGVHLCCGKCVKAVNEVLGTVPGVTGNTAAKGVKTFEVTGSFNDQAVFDALQKAGFTGQEK